MLELVSKTDAFYAHCLERMRSTISPIKYEGDVQFNDYTITQVFKINHTERKNRFHKKKQLFDMEMRKTKVFEVFHGSQHAHKIAKGGFNAELCHSKNRFGRGFYFAPESSKAATYAFGVNRGCPTHNDYACTLCVRKMLICKLAMGKSYVAKKIGAPPPGYNSVVAYPENIPSIAYPEFAVFHPDQILPIALIEYKITNDVPRVSVNDLARALESMSNPSEAWTTVVGAVIASLENLAADEAFSNAEQRDQQQQNEGGQRRGGGRRKGRRSRSAGRSNNPDNDVVEVECCTIL